MVGNPPKIHQNTWNMVLFLGKVVPESMAEIGLRLFFLSHCFEWFYTCEVQSGAGFQPAINTPSQFEKVFLILPTTSEGFFPLGLSSTW